MRLRTFTACAMATAVLVALTACGAGNDGAARPKADGKLPTDQTAVPAPKKVAAPVKFTKGDAITLPESASRGEHDKAAPMLRPLPVALHKGVAYIARPDGLDVVSGYQRGTPVTIKPQYTPGTKLKYVTRWGENPAQAPLITSYEGRTLVLSTLVTEKAGTGTTASRAMLELMATDADTAKKAWFAEIDLGASDHTLDRRLSSAVLGRSGDTVVVSAFDKIFGIDLKTQKHAWTAKGTYEQRRGAAVVGDMVVAVRSGEFFRGTVVGLRPADGSEAWVSPRTGDAVSTAGTDAVMAMEDGEEYTTVPHLLDAATGKIRRVLPEEAPGSDCRYDGTSVAVCARGEFGEGELAAYDFKTGKELWRLPDEAGTRVVPNVTLVQEGLVYAFTDNGPTVLDAATGEDKEAQPGIAPYATDGHVGLGLDFDTDEDQYVVTAYRTTR